MKILSFNVPIEINPKTLKILLILLAASILFWAAALVFQYVTAPPKLVSVIPVTGSKQVDPTDGITIITDKDVDASAISIVSNPKAVFQVKKTISKTYAAIPDPILHTNAEYRIQIYYKKTVIGEVSFATILAQSDPTILQQAKIWIDDNYPLLSYLPVRTANYEIYYTGPKAITIKKYLKTLADDAAKQVVLDLFSAHSIDPSTHTVTVVDGTIIPPVTHVESSNK